MTIFSVFWVHYYFTREGGQWGHPADNMRNLQTLKLVLFSELVIFLWAFWRRKVEINISQRLGDM
jgi:hypothetical protein